MSTPITRREFAEVLAAVLIGGFEPPKKPKANATVLFGGFEPPKKPKAKAKCRLPRCLEMTSHNGGYCCAAHCREHV